MTHCQLVVKSFVSSMSATGFRREPGDWPCSQCNEVNFKSRSACRRCSTPRSNATATPQIVPRAGDWKCRSCGNLNFAARTACNKCAVAKAEPMETDVRPAPVQTKPGDWKCGSCPEMNFGSRVVCRSCGAARPVPPAAAAATGSSAEKKDECVICMEKEIDTVFASCGHSAVCLDCGGKVTHCPMCRTAFTRDQLIKMFNVH